MSKILSQLRFVALGGAHGQMALLIAGGNAITKGFLIIDNIIKYLLFKR